VALARYSQVEDFVGSGGQYGWPEVAPVPGQRHAQDLRRHEDSRQPLAATVTAAPTSLVTPAVERELRLMLEQGVMVKRLDLSAADALHVLGVLGVLGVCSFEVLARLCGSLQAVVGDPGTLPPASMALLARSLERLYVPDVEEGMQTMQGGWDRCRGDECTGEGGGIAAEHHRGLPDNVLGLLQAMLRAALEPASEFSLPQQLDVLCAVGVCCGDDCTLGAGLANAVVASATAQPGALTPLQMSRLMSALQQLRLVHLEGLVMEAAVQAVEPRSLFDE